MKLYLDVCCLSRLTDDQLQQRIRLEATAIERIFRLVEKGVVDLVSSQVIQDEVHRTPSLERRIEIESLLALARSVVDLTEQVGTRAGQLVGLGYGAYDALHLASAEAAGVDALLSTDDRFVAKAERGLGEPRVPIKNPISWIQEHLNDGA